MKILSFISIIIPIMIGLQTVGAQKSCSLFNGPTVKKLLTSDSMQVLHKESRTNNINIKAVRDFIKSFKNIDSVKWYAIPDGSFAKFLKDGIEIQVYYDVSGKRRCILRSYDESHMMFEIRDIIKRQYYDYNILVVYEIENYDAVTYIVKIKYRNNLKVLQITDNDMVVSGDYVLNS